MTEKAARHAISREVRRALSAAGLSAAAAAAKMPSRPGAKLIYRWANAEVTAPFDRLEEFAQAVGQSITIRLGPDATKEPQPEWAGAMESRIRSELKRNRDLIEALAPDDIRLAAERVIERLEARLTPDDEVPGERNGSEDQDAAEPRVREPG